MLSEESGRKLVSISRRIVEEIAENNEIDISKMNEENVREEIKKFIQEDGDKKLNEKFGVFVSIKNSDNNSLRGCIGFISPSPLWESVQHVAVLSAFCDPRFTPLKKDELDNVIFEISVMTEPVLISGDSLEEMKEKIKIGRDGLIIINGNYNGLLLPQIAVENNMNVDEFLEALCSKANLTKDFLRDENTSILKFECQIFAEKEPSGEIIQIKNF